ncbi:MAG: filamentous hemagglutinin N-terminal domain-containing protein, partial [Waterburya sp.]
MKKILSFVFQASFVACCSLITHNTVTAQGITSDGTLSQPTEVSPTDAGVEINGGTVKGGNLFHSFGDFSVPAGSEAHFNNSTDVVNILNRVTGGNVSQIDGLIRANGGANLFLINPAGIIFGEGAQLDIGGSFFGTTADSLLFDNGGEFSATDPQAKPILTINAPIGLNLRDNPQPISNQSTANGVGLEVQPGKNITLVGGELNFNGGILTAPGGRIELGGLSTPGKIDISSDGSLTFPDAISRADVTFTNGAEVNVASDGGGFINVNADNLTLSQESQFLAGIAENQGVANAQAGDTVINVTDNLTLDESRITNQVNQDGVGNSGNININTGSLTAINGGEFDASTSGQGDAGLVEIIAKGDVTFDGVSLEGDRSGAISRVNSDGEGNTGGVTISTTNLTLTNGGRVDSSTKGIGNAGLIEIVAKGDVTFDGATSEGDLSGATSRVDSDGEGNAGGVTISTTNLTLTNGGEFDASTSGQGDAGLVEIIAKGDVIFDGVSLEGDRSGA